MVCQAIDHARRAHWPEVLYEVDGHVATLTLNRPHRRNAISFRMLELLTEHLTAAERSGTSGA